MRDGHQRLRYTICFCRRGDLLLMLYRCRPPNRHRWNGLGGKIEPGEAPLASVRREVLEEAGVDLDGAASVRLAGVATWAAQAGRASATEGMYCFIADLPGDYPIWAGGREVPEGLLGWKPVGWVCEPGNPEVVDNIPRFLPRMLRGGEPAEYRCEYGGGRLVEMRVLPLEHPIGGRQRAQPGDQGAVRGAMPGGGQSARVRGE